MQNIKPLVSVIIPFYNAENFIKEAIETVFSQTYNNWELILVNDGSNDGSTDIALQYAKLNLNRVSYFEHEDHRNQGTCASRNLGIRNSRGAYVALLDADDAWLNNKLSEQVEILTSNPEVGMVFGSTKYWHSWSGNPKDKNSDYIPEPGIQTNTVYRPPQLLTLLYPLGKGAAPCPSDLLLKREILDLVGGFEESWTGKYQLYEDQVFLTKIYLRVPIYVSGECWDLYRFHKDSCMERVIGAGEYDSVRLSYLNWLERYLTEQNVTHSKIWHALKNALLPYRHPNLNRIKKFYTSLSERKNRVVDSPYVQTLLMSLKNLTIVDKDRLNPPVGKADFGSLRRLTPISCHWGFDRGLPIDRYYIAKFIHSNSDYIKGHVLEIGDDYYTRKYGNGRVNQIDILHLSEGVTKATITGDLASADHIPSDTFDCIIFTQTLQYIYDARAAIRTLNRILKPAGVILASFPGISQTYDKEWGKYWFWNFTSLSATKLFEEFFDSSNLWVQTHGNVFVAISFLHGLASEELTSDELDYKDEGYQFLITVKAIKPRKHFSESRKE